MDISGDFSWFFVTQWNQASSDSNVFYLFPRQVPFKNLFNIIINLYASFSYFVFWKFTKISQKSKVNSNVKFSKPPTRIFIFFVIIEFTLSENNSHEMHSKKTTEMEKQKHTQDAHLHYKHLIIIIIIIDSVLLRSRSDKQADRKKNLAKQNIIVRTLTRFDAKK